MMEQRFPAGLREHLLNNLMAPPVLELKPGAQVMLIVNQPAFSLYNGSVGIVREFIDGFPRVVFTTMTGAVVDVVVRPQKFSVEGAGGKVVGQRMQVPLILAWALSIHKSQGQSASYPNWATASCRALIVLPRLPTFARSPRPR
jgi:ATP-dependent DNA helicase PIF1